MKIEGKVWKDGKEWLADIPFLNLLIQARTKKEMPAMAQDAIALLIDDESTVIDTTLTNDTLYIETDNPKKLIALILKRQRLKKSLTLEDVTSLLKSKSINEYAQYEKGKHLPSFEKFEQLLKAIDPKLDPVITLR